EGAVSRQNQTTLGPFNTLRTSLNNETGTLSRSGALRIIPHAERQTLYITGPDDVVAQVMEAIEVLDAESPKDRDWRVSPVEHADANDVAEIVRDLYKQEMDGGQQQTQQQNRGGGFNPFNPFGGGFGGFGQQNQPNNQGRRPVQLSVSVDARTNTLLVN